MNTSKDAVHDYLNAMFMDVALTETVIATPDIESETILKPSDTIPSGAQVVACMDPFEFLAMTNKEPTGQQWLALLLVLGLCRALPNGDVKSYCLNHCQILLNQWHNRL